MQIAWSRAPSLLMLGSGIDGVRGSLPDLWASLVGAVSMISG